MNLNEFIERNGIAIAAKANSCEKSFNIIKRDIDLESYDLFEQLILFSSVDSLIKSIEGQILPRIWTQGNTKCVVCQPTQNQVIALFYDSQLDAKNEYFHAQKLDSELKELEDL